MLTEEGPVWSKRLICIFLCIVYARFGLHTIVILNISLYRRPLTVTASPATFSKKYGITPPDHNAH